MNKDDLKLVILLNALLISIVILVLLSPSDIHIESLLNLQKYLNQ